jgi:hypothetical protein
VFHATTATRLTSGWREFGHRAPVRGGAKQSPRAGAHSRSHSPSTFVLAAPDGEQRWRSRCCAVGWKCYAVRYPARGYTPADRMLLAWLAKLLPQKRWKPGAIQTRRIVDCGGLPVAPAAVPDCAACSTLAMSRRSSVDTETLAAFRPGSGSAVVVRWPRCWLAPHLCSACFRQPRQVLRLRHRQAAPPQRVQGSDRPLREPRCARSATAV